MVAERSVRLTKLWTETYSGLWLEARGSQAHGDPAKVRIANNC